MNNRLLYGSSSEVLRAIYWKLLYCILVVHMSMHQKFLAHTHDVGWEDETLSAPQNMYFHLSCLVQRWLLMLLMSTLKLAQKKAPIMLSQEAPAFERLSQRLVTNLSPCGNKKGKESGA